MLNILHNNGSRIFYVSKSESNLFATLTYFIINKDLPVGYLHLTPYISFYQLFKTKGGKNYKKTTIRFILNNSHGKKYIFLGDDTHHDMRIYFSIARIYPDRILKIYIRKTGFSLPRARQKDMNMLNSLNIPVVYFSDKDDMTKEITYLKNLKINSQVHY